MYRLSLQFESERDLARFLARVLARADERILRAVARELIDDGASLETAHDAREILVHAFGVLGEFLAEELP